MRFRIMCVVVGLLCGPREGILAQDKWEAEVAKLEARLTENAPVPGGVLFAGSSSIRLWNLAKWFPAHRPVNAGFGGSTIPDCARFAPRLIFPWKPAQVVFYAGDNDLANGRPPGQVARDFMVFASTVHAVLPECRITFLSIKPSPSRWKLWPQAREANALIRGFCESVGAPRLDFLDLTGTLLGPDGRPRAELFLADQLHLNEAGYAAWTAALAPRLIGK